MTRARIPYRDDSPNPLVTLGPDVTSRRVASGVYRVRAHTASGRNEARSVVVLR